MSSNKQWTNAADVCLSAILTRIRMPVETLASLKSGDIIEVEPYLGTEPSVRLSVHGRTVAIATLIEDEGVIRATITQLDPDEDREFEKWELRTSETRGIGHSQG